MNRKEVFGQVLRQIDWLKDIIGKRGWDLAQDLVLEGPATEEEIARVERELGAALPEDYRDLFRLSRRLEFRYEYDEEMPAEFGSISSGEISWNLGQLKEQQENLREWVEVLSSGHDGPGNAAEAQLWAGKVPLAETAGGDIIVVGSSPSEVVYFSCQEYAMHGKRLAGNLWEFLELHARIGFAGSDDGQLAPFYETVSGGARVKGESVDRFAEWLSMC